MQQNIRLGVVGVGPHAAENLMPVIQCLEGVEVRAISSRSGKDKARQLAQRYGAAWETTEWRDLVTSGEIDAVLVAAPPSVHQEVARACLDAGVHVFVEKPPATDLSSLEELVRLAAGHPEIISFVDYNFRFGSTYLTLRETMQAEAELAAARIRFVGSKPVTPLWGQDSVERSFLYAFAIHAVEMVVNLFGTARDVRAVHRNLDGDRFLLDLSITFTSGATACLELGNYTARFEYHVELVSKNAAVGVLDQHRRIAISRAADMEPFDPRLGAKQLLEYVWPSMHGGYELTGYQGSLEAFVGAIRQGTPSAAPLSGSIEVYRIIEEALSQIGPSRS